MRKQSVESIVRALNDAKARYLIAGGLAVVAHGHLRSTANVDLVLDLDTSNAMRALTALAALGYRPRAPVRLEEFADPRNRQRRIDEKAMTVFSLHSPNHPETEVDLFVNEPFDFDTAYRSASRDEIAPGVPATFVGYEDLVRWKQQAGRPQDLVDLERLRAIREGRT
jgi:hypothetical protein